MSTVAVTGATGRLGRALVPRLVSAGYDVRGFSRRAARGTPVDLTTGAGLDDGLKGVDTVVHLATSNNSADVRMAEVLSRVASRAGIAHLVVVSIVGVDRVPLAYYRHKLAAEQVVLASRAPVTVLRATQFHELLDAVFRVQRRLPVRFTVDLPVQPVAASDVADRLVALVGQESAGRVADVGGPERLTWQQASHLWGKAHRPRQASLTLPAPGKVAGAIRAGRGLAEPWPGATLTYEAHLAGAASTTRFEGQEA